MPVRIYDISKKLRLENKEVLAKAKELGIVARVASSSLDKITAEYLEDQLKAAHPELTAPPPPPPPPPPAPEPAPAPPEAVAPLALAGATSATASPVLPASTIEIQAPVTKTGTSTIEPAP